MKLYRKMIIRGGVFIICIFAAVVSFQEKAAAQGASDDFEGGTAGNNYFDGGTGWDGNWIVSSTARVSVVTQSASQQLNLSNGCNAYREVDLSSASSATLTFDFEDASNDETYVDISTDGGSNWTLGATAYTSDGSYSVDLGSTLTADFLIRFRSTGNNDNDDVYIDNVQITTVVRAVSLIVDDKYSEDQTVSVTISRGDTTGDVTVDLSSSDTSVAEFAVASVTIPVGSSEVTVNLTLKDIDGIKTVTLTATDQADPDVYLGDTEEIKVIDDDYAGSYSGDSMGFPTSLMITSYDWLHNFYDDNARADGTTTDPDTDNFNKVIMVDSNLFPIYTALKGDQEWPNVVMRNWDAGPGTGNSPSVNDYMNRSVAVVSNYINTTTNIPITYDRIAEMSAVGMRTHPEWAYVVDPANANFRRYKFIKIADVAFPAWYDGMPDGDVEELVPDGDADDLHKCDTCCPGVWYVGAPDDLLCDIPSNDACCPSTNAPNCYDADTKLMYAPKEAGNTSCGGSTATIDYMACTNTSADSGIPGSGNYGHYASYGGSCTDDTPSKSEAEKASPPSPYGRFPIFLTHDQLDAGSTIDVTFDFKGHTHSTDAGVVFVLNGSAKGVDDIGEGCECERFALKQGSDWGVQDSSPCESFTGGGCRSEYSVTFSGVPSKCAMEFDDEYKVMYVDLYPCDHGGMVIEVPDFDPKDNAFQIPVPGVDTSDGISAGEQTIIDNRWANLTAYLDTVPPRSYPGYGEYTSSTLRTLGYGFTTNTSFTHARNVRFKDPRDIDAYRDYFDIQNEGPTYIFVADTMNSRIQVFMNATGSAGDPNASFPIRPVRVAKRAGSWSDSSLTEYNSNELAMRIHTGINNTAVIFGDGRKADWRHYTTVSGAGVSATDHTLDDKSRIPAAAGRGEFYYPHGVAVDQDPDTKDVYLFVADTFNHRIQIFRDTTGVTNHAITNKRFDFQYAEGWGTYPLQTTQTVTPPGPFSFRYPKGVDVVRFANNSSYLYVVDSKNYRLMKYLISEGSASQGITAVKAVNAYGYDGAAFDASLFSTQGVPMTASSTEPGFLNPQDVATGYSGFHIFTSPAGKGIQFLNNYMVYVSDYARNNTSISRDHLNMRVQQFIQVPTFANMSGSWIPWDTEAVVFGSWTSNNLELGQSVYGISYGLYSSTGTIDAGADIVEGSTNNVPGRPDLFTDRPVGAATLQWNTKKPIDIRVVKESSPTAVYVNGATVPRSSEIRIGASSRYLFMPPEDNYDAFMNSSTEVSETAGRWDGLYTGRVHIFCYDKFGQFDNHSALHTAPYRITLSSMGCQAKGFAKIVVEDGDFAYSGRTGTMFFRVGN